MLTLPADLYDPGPYADAGGVPLWFASNLTFTLTGATSYLQESLRFTRGNVVVAGPPPGLIAYVVEARLSIIRTGGAGILDQFGWFGMNVANGSFAFQLSFANDLTALSAASSRQVSANNPWIAEALQVRDVVLFPGETLAFGLWTASDTTTWNVQPMVRGWLLPRGNLNRI